MNDLIAAAKAARLKASCALFEIPRGRCRARRARPNPWRLQHRKRRLSAGLVRRDLGHLPRMIMAGGTRITEMAVIGNGDVLCTPCGGCRQKIREFAKGDVKIHMCCRRAAN